MDIIKGKQKAPIRAVVYGPEGIGKSTFASRWPAPLFVDVEGGTLRLDVDRVRPTSWSAVQQIVSDVRLNPGPYQTLVFDTADWLDRMTASHVCQANGWLKGIETPGYGQGFVAVGEAWKSFLDQLPTTMHVVFLAHAVMRKHELPDEAGAFDRWEMKTSKHVAPLLKEWSDLLLFLNYRTIVIETDGKPKAQGGERVMNTTHHPCWDAKNRFGLKDQLPLGFASIASIFDDTPADLKPAAAPAQQATTQPVADDPEKATLLRQLAELMKGSGVTMAELDAELARKGVCPAGMNPRQYNVATLQRIVTNWDKVHHNIEARRQPTSTAAQ